MNIHQLSFLSDENIDREVVEHLRNQGFNVFDIKEQGLFRMTDRDILQFAFQHQRVVISQDSDFGMMIFRDQLPVCGVIYLRPGHVSPEVHVETMQAVLEAGLEFSFPFILVGENYNGLIKIRLRQL